ncbi:MULTISPECIES: slipin family protein [unclassified Streptomyces]|uniref:slipin family protein n=1 Tax=unclassified Streptomyces TaxID=2593676 RepID=UPI002E2B5C7A|nr:MULTISPECIES: SPFH domain-containing protein [unclassified Streptomyces]WUB86204.1 SPFH domain-containing protein [Streptomyces sp. NBC_00566]
MLEIVITLIAVFGALGLICLAAAMRVVKQYERGVLFRLGRITGEPRQPGLTLIIPFVDRLHKMNMQIVTLPIPAQEGITRDNVTVRVDAVVYFRVVEPTDALVRVEDYRFAVSQMAQTSLRSIIGKSDLDDLLSNREKLNEGLELMIDSPAVGWGVQIDRVEIKDVSLPDTMKRSMARQAEADRERRARIINADAEYQASKKLAQAAQQMADTPTALQLRLLQTVMAVSAEKNSTLVLPIPVELLHFLERGARDGQPTDRKPERPAEPVTPEEPVTLEKPVPPEEPAPQIPPTQAPASPYLDALTGPPELGAVLDQPQERVTHAEGRPEQP